MAPRGRRGGFRSSHSNFHSHEDDWQRAPSRYIQELETQPWESQSVAEFGRLPELIRSQTCTDDALVENKSAIMMIPKSWEVEAVVGDKSQWYSSSYDVSYNPSQHSWIPQTGWESVQAPAERKGKRDNLWTYRELNKTLTEARQAKPPRGFQRPSNNSQEPSVEVAPGPKVLAMNEMKAAQTRSDELPARQDGIAVQQPVEEAVEVPGEISQSGNIKSVMKERKITASLTSTNPVIHASVDPPSVPLTRESDAQSPFHSGGYSPEHTAALLQTFNDTPLASAAHTSASITMGTSRVEVDDDTRAKKLSVDAPRPSTLIVPATPSAPVQKDVTVIPRPTSCKQSEQPGDQALVAESTKLELPQSISASQHSPSQPTKSTRSINIPGFDPNKYGSPTAKKLRPEDPHRDLGKTSLTTSYPNNESSAAASSTMQDTTATESHSFEVVHPQNGIALESHTVEEVQSQNPVQVNGHCAQDFDSPSQTCETSANVTTSSPQTTLIPRRGRQNGVSNKAKSKNPEKEIELQGAPGMPETKEETLQRLQQQQLTTVGYRLRHKGDRGRPSTVSLQDLELARRPLPADLVVSIEDSRSSLEPREPTTKLPQADPSSNRVANSLPFQKLQEFEMKSVEKADALAPTGPGEDQDFLRVLSQRAVQHPRAKSADMKPAGHVSKNHRSPSHPGLGEGNTANAETRQSASHLSKNKTSNSRWATPDEVRSPVWDVNSNAWGSEVASNASVASEDSTKPMHRGKPFMNKPIADHDPSLVGWDGKMQPPPVDWNDRPNFNSHSSQFRNSLHRYLNEAGSLVVSPDFDLKFEPMSNQMVEDLTLHPDGIGFVKRKSGVTMTTARDYGYNMSFAELIEETGPLRPLGDDDLMDWGKLDLSFGDNFKYKEETTNKLVDTWYAHKFGRRISAETQASKITQDTTPSPEINETELVIKSRVPEIHPHSPSVNIYIRPAVRTDMDQLTRIYNWYVQSSPRTTEIHVTSRDDMEGRFQDSTSSKLPWLVAVARSHKRLRQIKGENENIVGFALATDFTNVDQAERVSAELELYVDKDCLHRGVGRCLLDKLLESTDRGYLPRGGYAFTCDPSDRHCYSAGGARDLHKLVFMIRHFKYPKEKPKAVAEEENDVMEWIIPWLEKKFDFEKEGCFKGIGAKFGRYVNLTYMGYETKWCPKEGEIPENLPGAF